MTTSRELRNIIAIMGSIDRHEIEAEGDQAINAPQAATAMEWNADWEQIALNLCSEFGSDFVADKQEFAKAVVREYLRSLRPSETSSQGVIDRAYEAAKEAMPYEALVEIAPGELERVVKAVLNSTSLAAPAPDQEVIARIVSARMALAGGEGVVGGEPVAEVVAAATPAAEILFGRDIKLLSDFRDLPIGTKLYAMPTVSARMAEGVETDESEIITALLANEPFVFDPATNFMHADDGGAPDHGIKYVPERDRKYYSDRFFSLVNALRDWPKMPEPRLLMQIRGTYPEDWSRGKEIQNELGVALVPPKTECEIGAGVWDRITKGEWRAATATNATPTPEREDTALSTAKERSADV